MDGNVFVLDLENKGNLSFGICFQRRSEWSDTYYVILFILLLEKEEKFDWGKYLLEGEEIYFGPGIDSPVSNFLKWKESI